MTRNYTLKKRAEQQADTRRRIVDAAVELHSTVGPAATTFSMVAEKAGVQRHTLYAHFPDERSLNMACSGLVHERDPLPDAAAWRMIAGRRERLRVALGEIYGWYARHASLMGCVMRDMEHHALTREIGDLRFGPVIHAWFDVLGTGMSEQQIAMLRVALNYFTWRTLVRDAGLTHSAAIAIMANAISATK
jgi:AcrR family transcriptional regulator